MTRLDWTSPESVARWRRDFGIVNQAKWEASQAATIDGVLRREGDVWATTDPRHGTITHTLRVATGDECVPADCDACARGPCLIEVQECDAWDARVIVHDPGRDERS